MATNVISQLYRPFTNPVTYNDTEAYQYRELRNEIPNTAGLPEWKFELKSARFIHPANSHFLIRVKLQNGPLNGVLTDIAGNDKNYYPDLDDHDTRLSVHIELAKLMIAASNNAAQAIKISTYLDLLRTDANHNPIATLNGITGMTTANTIFGTKYGHPFITNKNIYGGNDKEYRRMFTGKVALDNHAANLFEDCTLHIGGRQVQRVSNAGALASIKSLIEYSQDFADFNGELFGYSLDKRELRTDGGQPTDENLTAWQQPSATHSIGQFSDMDKSFYKRFRRSQYNAMQEFRLPIGEIFRFFEGYTAVTYGTIFNIRLTPAQPQVALLREASHQASYGNNGNLDGYLGLGAASAISMGGGAAELTNNAVGDLLVQVLRRNATEINAAGTMRETYDATGAMVASMQTLSNDRFVMEYLSMIYPEVTPSSVVDISLRTMLRENQTAQVRYTNTQMLVSEVVPYTRTEGTIVHSYTGPAPTTVTVIFIPSMNRLNFNRSQNWLDHIGMETIDLDLDGVIYPNSREYICDFRNDRLRTTELYGAYLNAGGRYSGATDAPLLTLEEFTYQYPIFTFTIFDSTTVAAISSRHDLFINYKRQSIVDVVANPDENNRGTDFETRIFVDTPITGLVSTVGGTTQFGNLES